MGQIFATFDIMAIVFHIVISQSQPRKMCLWFIYEFDWLYIIRAHRFPEVLIDNSFDLDRCSEVMLFTQCYLVNCCGIDSLQFFLFVKVLALSWPQVLFIDDFVTIIANHKDPGSIDCDASSYGEF